MASPARLFAPSTVSTRPATANASVRNTRFPAVAIPIIRSQDPETVAPRATPRATINASLTTARMSRELTCPAMKAEGRTGVTWIRFRICISR